MRLFIALQLPAAVLRPLAETAARLRPELPPARWVPVSNLHLTLRFLGETDADRVAGLVHVLAGCFASRRPLRLRLKGGGCFPPRRPARVAWVGFEPVPALAELQALVATAAGDCLGIGAEDRGFHAHLTLARPRRPWPRAAVDRWRAALDGPQGPAFDIAEGHLMRSHLGPGGARHESLGIFPLAGAEDGTV
jgi:2'-5' RNA ligase